MNRIELEDFYNAGFGWICRHCERELKDQEKRTNDQPRLMREGESESKQPRFSNPALAKWMDKAQTTLICPRCGLTEQVDKY